MKILKKLFVLVLFSTLIHCSSMPKLEKNSPTELENVYYQKWNAGTQEGGSGVNVFIKIKDASVTLDSLYFRGQVTELKVKPNNHLLYVGRFKSNISASNDKSQESSDFPFELKDNEGVISYFKDNKVRYFKISNIEQRVTINYPSSPSNL